jgi:hypothetical protein
MHAYILRGGFFNGLHFCKEDGRAVPRQLFTDYLALIFWSCGLKFLRSIKWHSFRIGAATFAAECGLCDAQIRLLGPWKSDAFRKYIRSPDLRAGITQHRLYF